MSDATQKFLEDFAPNVTRRLDNLEAFARRADNFLFKDQPGKPALATIAYGVHRHVQVWCTYADWCSRAGRFLARWAKRILIISAAVTATTAAFIALAHFFGVDIAHAQALNEKGTFRDYVQSVAHSPELGHFGVLISFGLVGVFANWFWKWVTDQIGGSLVQYLVHDNPKRTLASLCCIGGWSLWAIDPSLSWTQTINLALTTGFAIDVLVNKASRKEWTNEERKAATGK